MHLTPDAVVYDIGSRTGSIAVEMARLSDNLTVYAIERKQEAVALIEKNCTKYGLANVKVISGEAPGALHRGFRFQLMHLSVEAMAV